MVEHGCVQSTKRNWPLQCAEVNLWLGCMVLLKSLKAGIPLRLTLSVYMLRPDETISLFQVSTAVLRGQSTVFAPLAVDIATLKIVYQC